jgi:Uma2 family endonuclease
MASSKGTQMEYELLRRNCVLLRKAADMNALEYYATPESVLPTELAFGALHVRDSPSFLHQEAVGSFFVALREHARANALGRVCIAPLDVVLDEVRALIVQPDVFYIANDRSDMIGRRIYGAPDLVVEVLSPHPRVGDFERRLGWFARYGVRECWAYHQPSQRLEIVTFTDREIDRRSFISLEDPIDSVCLPEFTLTLRQVLDR